MVRIITSNLAGYYFIFKKKSIKESFSLAGVPKAYQGRGHLSTELEEFRSFIEPLYSICIYMARNVSE